VDLPVFVDVSSIVAGYSLQTGVTVGGVVSSERAVQGNYGSISGQAVYTDRPTITYVPMTGEKFLRGLITPIDPKNIFFMLQAGYPADFILGLTVESLNGVRNRSAAGGMVREADPEFVRVQQLLRDVQAAGGVGMRVEEDKAKGSTAVLFFQRDDLPADIQAKSAEIRRLLRLQADQPKFALTYSPMRGADNELAVNSRSLVRSCRRSRATWRFRNRTCGTRSPRRPSRTRKQTRGKSGGSAAARPDPRRPMSPCSTGEHGSGWRTATG